MYLNAQIQEKTLKFMPPFLCFKNNIKYISISQGVMMDGFFFFFFALVCLSG